MSEHRYSHGSPRHGILDESRSTPDGNPRRTITGRVKTAKKGLRVHQCESCDKIYTRNEHLKRHKKSHSAARYTCAFQDCSKTFVREDLLRNHFKTHKSHPLERTQSSPIILTTKRTQKPASVTPVGPAPLTSSVLKEESTGGEDCSPERQCSDSHAADLQTTSQDAVLPTTSSVFRHDWVPQPDTSCFSPDYGTPYTNGPMGNHPYFSPYPFSPTADTMCVGAWSTDLSYNFDHNYSTSTSMAPTTYITPITPRPSPYSSPHLGSNDYGLP